MADINQRAKFTTISEVRSRIRVLSCQFGTFCTALSALHPSSVLVAPNDASQPLFIAAAKKK